MQSSRAIHLELSANQCKQKFIMALEKLIAESRRASVIYSHNLITFVAASKWIGKINIDKRMQE